MREGGGIPAVIRAGLRWIPALVASKAFRAGFIVIAAALAGWALVARWTEVLAAVHRMQPALLVAAIAVTGVNLACTCATWRVVLDDLGSRLPWSAAARVFFVGQVGKYLPGSLWPVVVQAELGSDHGVPRRRSAAATLILILLSALSGLLVALICLPLVPAVADNGFGWVLLLVVPLLVVVHPGVLTVGMDRLLGLIGRPPLGERTTLRGTALALGWAMASWLCAGLQVFFLIVSLGARPDLHTLALAVGGYALAWAVGLVVVIAPAGAGPREVALAAVLSSVLDAGAVLVAVLLSRMIFTVADLLLAAVGLGLGRPSVNRAEPVRPG